MIPTSPATPTNSVPAPTPEVPVNQELLMQLKALRNTTAINEQQPLYMVFSNESLEAMAMYLPQTKDDFAKLKGVGTYKLIKYGDLFVSLIVTYCKEHKLDSHMEALVVTKKEKDPKAYTESMETTVLYFKQGMTIDEIAELRKLSATTVMSHLVRAYARGADMPIDTFVSTKKQKAIKDAFEKFQTTQLTTVMEKLSGYSYNDLRWVRAQVQREGIAIVTT